MSSEKPPVEKPPAEKPPAGKPITANFELETKIRVIIQEVLNATMRKISQLHEKVSLFEEFFFTFKQRVTDIENKSTANEKGLARTNETINKNRADAQADAIKLEEEHEKAKIEMNEKTESIRQINKKLVQLQRQNETLNNELSKTKTKFLEYSEQMTALKEEVAWKISKYVEETAQVNTQIKVSNDEIKKEYFALQLDLAKNKEKYNEIIEAKDVQEAFNERVNEQMDQFQAALDIKTEDIRALSTKLEEMDTAIYSKIKSTESKLDKKIADLVESNNHIRESVKKVDGFAVILDEIRTDSETMERQLMKKFKEADQIHKSQLEQEVLTINKNMLETDKKNDKKFKSLVEGQEKTADFFSQKMEFLKVELETSISSKASRMMEEKSKSQSGATNSALSDLQDRMSKLTIDTTKSVSKIETMVKEVKSEVKHQIEDIKESVDTRISTTIRNIEESSGSGVSPEFVQSINEKIEKVADQCELQIFNMNKELGEQNLKVLAVERLKEEVEVKFQDLMGLNERNFEELDGRITTKLEKVMFLVTKMRGDAIIRNEFTDKEIKQLKKLLNMSKDEAATIAKLMPAFGECINLIMCLIFDAEYQHSKIIQDNLPSLNKDSNKFQNILEGVLYEYSDKKKPGIILYRHKEQKKTELVRATFNGYIQVWEELFEGKAKDKQDIIPKSFYKKFVEKSLARNSHNNSPRKDMSQPLNHHPGNQSKEFNSSKQLGHDESRGLVASSSIESSENMNRSFHIRKKKNTAIRSREDIIVVVREDVREDQ